MNEVQAPEKLLKLIFNSDKKPAKWDAVDKVEGFITTLPPQNGDVTQWGTPGLYIRTLVMPAGTLITSKIHLKKHPYVVTRGLVTVYNTLTDQTETLKGGDKGITLPFTRRVLFVMEETEWVIFVPTDKIDENFEYLSEAEQQCIFDEIIAEITQHYDNPQLVGFDDGIFI